MTIKPINDNIVLKIEKNDDKFVTTESGIVLLNDASKNNKDANQFGTVVAIGPGRILNDGSRILSSVKIGDIVIFDAFAGTKISSDTDNYIIIKENNILGIL